LRSASAAARYVAVQRDADLQSLRNQAEDALVRDTVHEEAQNPAMAHGIEEALDVRGEHPVHLPPVHPGVKRIQRVMLATPRPEPIGEAHEVCLVDRLFPSFSRPCGPFPSSPIAPGLDIILIPWFDGLVQPKAIP